MDLGILMFVTERALPVTDLARACEERGLESLWVPEHPIVPVDYETRYPLSADGKLPRAYTELPDCFATLTAAAAATRRLRVGTGICLVPERDPLLTAHQVATLAWPSGGRFLFGIGAGWLRGGMELGAPPGMGEPAPDMLPPRELLQGYAEQGADRVVVSLPTLGAEDAYRHLDRLVGARP